MGVSIVMAARNAATTIRETLDSVRAQTYQSWELIIVDDGSSDATAELAAAAAQDDPRIRLIQQSASGVSVARNVGIGLARYELILFIDTDDLIAPEHIENLATALHSGASRGGVYSDWEVFDEDGHVQTGDGFSGKDDLFESLARRCVFAIHACLVRKDLIRRAGCFDPDIPVCEDWDLWQRIARTGATFDRVPGAPARVRVRSGSASSRTAELFHYGLRVIETGHREDARVFGTDERYALGAPVAGLDAAKLPFALYCAGEASGYAQPSIPLSGILAACSPAALRGTSGSEIASWLFYGARRAALRLLTLSSTAYWSAVHDRFAALLFELERHAMSAGLARGVGRQLAELIVRQVCPNAPMTLGTTHFVPIEVTQPIPDVSVADTSVEGLIVRVMIEGRPTGYVELPIFDGSLPGFVLSDAIASRFAWEILGRFLAGTVYKEIDWRTGHEGMSLYRGPTVLVASVPEGGIDNLDSLHDAVGWTVFLQELWGLPEQDASGFYSPDMSSAADAGETAGNLLPIEIGSDLPAVQCEGTLFVTPTLGGSAIGVVRVEAAGGLVAASQLRAAITLAAGFELCVAAVREALIGAPLSGLTLRQRLASRAASIESPSVAVEFPPGAQFAPGASSAAARGFAPGRSGMVISSRVASPIGGSASRRSALPHEIEKLVATAAAEEKLPVVRVGANGGAVRGRVLYNPEVVWLPEREDRTADRAAVGNSSCRATKFYDRAHWEAYFAAGADPWDYTNSYEKLKYDQTLSLIPEGPIQRALELGCAEGHFTAMLAGRVERLTAADISEIALNRARERCAGKTNIAWRRLNLIDADLEGPWDLIVCSEILYYSLDMEELRAVAGKLAGALRPGGWLITAHAHILADDPDALGFDWALPFGGKRIGEVLAETGPLTLVRMIRTPLYRVQALQSWAPFGITVDIREAPHADPLPARLEAEVNWRSSEKAPPVQDVSPTTNRLPILMYHRVAPQGSEALSEWRVHPKEFDEQMRYLSDNGFHTIAPEEWRLACAAHRPIPGRAVMITFDDGYVDFAQYAWPVLKRFGFTPYLFVPTQLAGKINEWDAQDEELPLLDWPDIRRLSAEGVQIGSHARTHRNLLSLTYGEACVEMISSRMELSRQLGKCVDAIAYPFGGTNGVLAHLAGACGYQYGFSTDAQVASQDRSLLDLPRLEIRGNGGFERFIANIGTTV